MSRRETMENSSRVYWRSRAEKRKAEQAAAAVGMSLSTWLRWLAAREIEGHEKAPAEGKSL
jgi:hypothetical protein